MMGKYFSKCFWKVMVSIMELWLQVKPGMKFSYIRTSHTAVVVTCFSSFYLVYLDWFEKPVIEMVCKWSYLVNDKHDDVIKWKHCPRYWPFVRGIHRSTVTSSHKGQWRVALKFYLICTWINDWVNHREAGELRRHRAHYDVIVMQIR